MHPAMAFDFAGTGLELIEAYGLLAIFILLVLDGALLLPVFPGELVMIIAVATYVDSTGSLLFLILLTTAAGLLGSILLYGIIRIGGRRLVTRFPGFFMMPRRRRERLERVFQNPFGQTLVLFLRLFPLTRVLVNIPAGLAKMPFVRFILLSTVGLLAYQTGFLWFTYEAGRAESPIASETQRLQEAYASPAWDFVQANAIVTGLVVIALGIVLSIRASARMLRDPEESTGSLIGSLATMVLFWGGIALAVATYTDPQSVYALIRLGGLDMDVIATAVGYSRVQVLFAVAAAAVFVGFVLRRVSAAARRRRRQELRIQRHLTRKREEARARAREEAPFRPVPPPAEPGRGEDDPDGGEGGEAGGQEDDRAGGEAAGRQRRDPFEWPSRRAGSDEDGPP